MAPNDRSSSRGGTGGKKPSTGSRPGAPGARSGSGKGGKPPGGGRSGASSRKGAPPRSGGSGGSARPEREEARTAGPKNWGSLGRKGAGRLTAPEFDARDSVGATGRDDRPAPATRGSDPWVRVDDVRTEAAGAVTRGKSTRPPKPGAPKGGPSKGGPSKGGTAKTTGTRAPASGAAKERRGRDFRNAGAGTGGAEAKAELVKALGASRGARANERLREAAHAFERERYQEARTLLKPLADQAPGAATVREFLGLTYYRLGQWKNAVTELEAFRQITGSSEQNPVLADAYRGLKKHRQVEELWDELREASPSADLVAEGRIVMAGSLADRKQLTPAITLLEKSHRATKSPQVHHLRQAYALADLYERAGDIARARELFRWVAEREPGFADAAERASSIG
ncbi:tetratricopeptide repeat protein [Aquihabitans daechungensis]|uniref:tetratricopeptide repeat protein n=1 Tax=Aquihabitans daechungensis TaxID=1052257 RepID=UPI003BA1681F